MAAPGDWPPLATEGVGGGETVAAAGQRGRGRLPVAGQAVALVVGDEPGGYGLLRRRNRGPCGGVAQLGHVEREPRAESEGRDLDGTPAGRARPRRPQGEREATRRRRPPPRPRPSGG